MFCISEKLVGIKFSIFLKLISIFSLLLRRAIKSPYVIVWAIESENSEILKSLL